MNFGVNLMSMLDQIIFWYRGKNSDKEIEALMIKRKDETKWKNNEGQSDLRCIIIIKVLGFMILLDPQ